MTRARARGMDARDLARGALGGARAREKRTRLGAVISSTGFIHDL